MYVYFSVCRNVGWDAAIFCNTYIVDICCTHNNLHKIIILRLENIILQTCSFYLQRLVLLKTFKNKL